MKKRIFTSLTTCCFAVTAGVRAQDAGQAKPTARQPAPSSSTERAAFDTIIQPFFKKHCINCPFRIILKHGKTY